jgi:hypothetical protein
MKRRRYLPEPWSQTFQVKLHPTWSLYEQSAKKTLGAGAGTVRLPSNHRDKDGAENYFRVDIQLTT